MTGGSFRFDQFVLDCGDRLLLRGGERVDINSRYLDALGLLVREQGRLVSKDRFLDEVWRGVPVTDEALTQCIRTLRRSLGDDVSRPRFIETVPKHGYRFIAAVNSGEPARRAAASPRDWTQAAKIAAAATIGGGIAGFAGGLIYGFAAASAPEAQSGTVSILLVIQCLTIVVALMGGAGVGIGLALTAIRDWRWSTAGGALGGVVVGAVVKLLGIDAFHLLFGQAPAGITGGKEGLLVGAVAGLGTWVTVRSGMSLRRSAAVASFCGVCGGLVIAALGGKMMAGSLDLLAHTFPNSNLRLDALWQTFGEAGVGTVTRYTTSALECGLFTLCVAISVRLAVRSSSVPRD